MLLNSKQLNEINKLILLKNEDLSEIIEAGYTEMLGVLDNALEELKKLYSISLKLTLETTGDYTINTNNQIMSPITFIIKYKSDKTFVQNNLYPQKNSSRQNIDVVGDTAIITQPTSYALAEDLADIIQDTIEGEVRTFAKYGTIRLTYEKLNIKIMFVYDIGHGDYVFTDNGQFNLMKYDKAVLNINKKIKDTNYNFCDICRLFKTFELELFLTKKTSRYFSLSYYFIETLVYNIPNQILQAEDIFDSYVKCVNYLNVFDIKKMVYLDDTKIDDEILLKNYKRFISKIKYFMLNAVEVLEYEAKISSEGIDDNDTLKGKLNKKIQDIINN